MSSTLVRYYIVHYVYTLYTGRIFKKLKVFNNLIYYILCVGISARVLIIERLKYLNLEISTGRLISTKENISIRCRINPSKEHTWLTFNSKLNLILDLIHNFCISWGKRKDNLDQKIEILLREHQK